MSKHTNDIFECESCEVKLLQVVGPLVDWYRWLKWLHPTVHIAWGFRDRTSQNVAYNTGKSRLAWPDSRHNALNERGVPCAEALDIFELSPKGEALFPIDLYQKIYEESLAQNMPIEWGGSWEHFKDYDHFQIKKGDVKNG